jgi:hypothetical protein
LVALQHALSAIALYARWKCVNGYRHWYSSPEPLFFEGFSPLFDEFS